MNINVGNSERIIRPIVAIGLVMTVVGFVQIPPWLAMVATYPFFTALFQWDPVYALFNSIVDRQSRPALHSDAAHGISA